MNIMHNYRLGRGFSLIIGGIFGIYLLYLFVPGAHDSIKFEDLALGKETITTLGKVDGFTVHCHNLDDFDECLLGYRKMGNSLPVTLWLGNSQVHAINQFKQGDETAVPILHRSLSVKKKYLMTLSQPNANLQEHYLLFSHMLNKLPLETLILPIVFDDMREDGIRTSLVDAFNDPRTMAHLGGSEFGKRLIANYGDQDAAGNDMGALEDTVQERFENTLNKVFEDFWPLWSDRPTLRGDFLNSLYRFRNFVLDINPSSTSRVIPGRYAKNRDAYSSILKLALKNGVKMMVYVVPLRNDVNPPYDLDEYSGFKFEMEAITQHYDAQFIDMENLVPAELWGTKGSTRTGGHQEMDFMHFQAGGHRLLADALFQNLIVLLNR